MSALPFATSLHSLSLAGDYAKREIYFEQVKLPWVAYALFHPHAYTSSWHQLELSDLKLTTRSHEVLSAMARGNNLLALLNGTSPDANAYYRGQLLPGTSIMVKQTATSNVLYTTPTGGATVAMTVDLCGITSIDPSTWNEWVAVLVPAYGLGYVQRHMLTRVDAYPPSRKPAFGLTLRSLYGRTNSPNAVLHLLTTLGPSLTYLDIKVYKDILTSTLFDILRACPSLKVLALNHSGHFWSKQSKDVPRIVLEELELSLLDDQTRVPEPSPAFLQASLRRLRVLRICVKDQ